MLSIINDPRVGPSCRINAIACFILMLANEDVFMSATPDTISILESILIGKFKSLFSGDTLLSECQVYTASKIVSELVFADAPVLRADAERDKLLNAATRILSTYEHNSATKSLFNIISSKGVMPRAKPKQIAEAYRTVSLVTCCNTRWRLMSSSLRIPTRRGVITRDWYNDAFKSCCGRFGLKRSGIILFLRSRFVLNACVINFT
jgi:hypothetical protein